MAHIDTGIDDVLNLVEHLRVIISEIVIPFQNTDIIFTSTIGLTQCYDSCTSLDSLIAMADITLYEAKRGGHNKVVVA